MLRRGRVRYPGGGAAGFEGCMSGVFMGGSITPPRVQPDWRGDLHDGDWEPCWHKDVPTRMDGHAAELSLT
jgi:hypothetical protein